ncbi:MAG: pyrroline-5-carboxylate reductase [Clostridia bacterium]
MQIAFIGAGNMGGALARGIIANRNDILVRVYDTDPSRLEGLGKEPNCTVFHSPEKACEDADMVVFALKPGILPDVMALLLPVLKGKLVVSVAAGIKLKRYEEILPGERIIRVMPNMPVLTGEGMTTVVKGTLATDRDLRDVLDVFDSVGRTMVLEEKDMDAATALAGSSPAYVFMLIEAMADAGVGLGLQRDKAYVLAAQAVMGSAKMVLEGGEHPASLKDKICSPGGATIEGVRDLEQEGFRQAMIKAVNAAAWKSMRMGEGR